MALSKKDIKRIEDEERARHRIRQRILQEEQGTQDVSIPHNTTKFYDKKLSGCTGCLVIVVATIIIAIAFSIYLVPNLPINASQTPASSNPTTSTPAKPTTQRKPKPSPNHSNLNDNELIDMAKDIIEKRFGDDASVFAGGPKGRKILKYNSDKEVVVLLEVRSTLPGDSPKGRLFERVYMVSIHQNESGQWQYIADAFAPWNP